MTEDVTPAPKPEKEHFHRSIFAKLRGYFLAGVLVTAPISITIYLTLAFLKFVDEKVSSIFPAQYHQSLTIPGLGLLIAVSFFILVGWFARNFLGRMVINMSEYVVDRVPVIGKIYGGIKQVFETLMGSQSQAFRDVVIFEYPRTGIWTLGFVTGTSTAEVQRKSGADVVNVFLPTAPSPTNGLVLFIPRDQLRYLDMTIEDAFKIILSSGIISPPDPLLNGNGNGSRKGRQDV